MTRVGRFGVSSIALGTAFLVAPLLPTDGPTICPFALTTGVPCPLCGMSRAAGFLFRGEIEVSLLLHPLALPLIAALLTAWVAWDPPRSDRDTAMKAATLAAAFIAIWVARWATGTLPPI